MSSTAYLSKTLVEIGKRLVLICHVFSLRLSICKRHLDCCSGLYQFNSDSYF